MFLKKKSSRERSRLGLPSWRNTRSSLTLVFSSLFRSPRHLASQLHTFTVSAPQLVLVLFPPSQPPLSLSLSLLPFCIADACVWKRSFFLPRSFLSNNVRFTIENFHLPSRRDTTRILRPFLHVTDISFAYLFVYTVRCYFEEAIF